MENRLFGICSVRYGDLVRHGVIMLSFRFV
jgi:hypothetical protein